MKAQGAMDYLLLIGGAIVVTVIVLSVLLGIFPETAEPVEVVSVPVEPLWEEGQWKCSKEALKIILHCKQGYQDDSYVETHFYYDDFERDFDNVHCSFGNEIMLARKQIVCMESVWTKKVVE